ncbi:LIPR2-like protein, partial [Mya arenaria]
MHHKLHKRLMDIFHILLKSFCLPRFIQTWAVTWFRIRKNCKRLQVTSFHRSRTSLRTHQGPVATVSVPLSLQIKFRFQRASTPLPTDQVTVSTAPVPLSLQIRFLDSTGPFHHARTLLTKNQVQVFTTPVLLSLQIKFLLYTRVNTHSPQHVSKEPLSIKQSHFQGSRRTAFIIHGYTDNGHSEWLTRMARAILQREDANVFVVDWEKGADNVNYAKSAANTRVVGALLAQFITVLHDTSGARYGDVHLIGHSLGSHISGYAGERIHGLGRITGLDPAGPLFENKDARVRLDPTDALFVDAIHTDGDSLLEL